MTFLPTSGAVPGERVACCYPCGDFQTLALKGIYPEADPSVCVCGGGDGQSRFLPSQGHFLIEGPEGSRISNRRLQL